MIRNRKRFKQRLVESLKILQEGERHKTWSYPIFENLPPEWVVSETTEVDKEEILTLVVYAGDIARNFLEFYWIHDIIPEKKSIECISIEEKHKIVTFYMDAVAIVPPEILPLSMRTKTIRDQVLIDQDKEKRKIKAVDRKGKLEKLKKIENELKLIQQEQSVSGTL